jgi:hypothetical protein
MVMIEGFAERWHLSREQVICGINDFYSPLILNLQAEFQLLIPSFINNKRKLYLTLNHINGLSHHLTISLPREMRCTCCSRYSGEKVT